MPRQIILENGFVFKSLSYNISDIKGKDIDYFVPAAFVTQDNFNVLGPKKYKTINSKLIEDSIKFISENSIRCIVNFSSGVVSKISDKQTEFESFTIYKSLKEEQEIKLRDICVKNGIKFVNCRVYSLSGYYVVNPAKYAFYDVLQNCLRGTVNIKSCGRVFRKYMDSCDLMYSLLKASQEFDNFECESSGALVEIEQLAMIASNLLNSTIKISRSTGDNFKDDFYFSEDRTLDNFNSRIGFMPKSLDEQVIRSIAYIGSKT